MDTAYRENIAALLRRRLPADVLRVIRQIGNFAEDKGLSAYIVGGFVRDILLNIKNLDLDIALEGDTINFTKYLQEKFELDVVTHQRFGTATVIFPNGFKIDIAGARKEHYASVAALPTVTFASIQEDLFRRDFTINALAIKINRNNFGQLLDPMGARQDLKEGKIKILHQRSFIDDPTRIFRAIRFEQRYNFAIDKHTVKLIKQAKESGALSKLSKFRIGDEIILILKERIPLRPLVRLCRLCGLRNIHPKIKLDQRTSRQFKSAQIIIGALKEDRFYKALDSWLVYFIILTESLNLAELTKLCRDFSLTKKDILKLKSFKRNGSFALRMIERKARLLPSRVYQILHPFSLEEVLALLAQTKSRKGKGRIKLFLRKLSRVKIKLTGKDLKRLGLEPGPKYRDILEKVLYAKIDGKLKSKAEELNCAKYILGN